MRAAPHQSTVRWPWSAAHHSPSRSLTPPPQQSREKKNKMKSSGVNIKTGRSLTNCYWGLNRPGLGKTNVLPIKIDLGGEKPRLKSKHFSLFHLLPRLDFTASFPTPLPPAHHTRGTGRAGNSSLLTLFACSSVVPSHKPQLLQETSTSSSMGSSTGCFHRETPAPAPRTPALYLLL